MNIEAPIIIVGCRRSGTTLLRSILNEHPQLKAHPKEPQFILELYRRYGRSLPNLSSAIEYIVTHPYLPQAVDPGTLRQRCRRLSSNVLHDLVHCYLEVWLDKKKKRPLLKVPAFVFHLDFIYQLFPDMYVVHIVRDPRANVLSQRARWPNASLWECAVWWRDAVRLACEWGEKGRTLYTELRYEDLVLDPESTLCRLCNELGIAYRPNLLDFELRSNLYEPDAPPQSITFTHIDSSRINLWQERLTPMEIKLIESCVESEMTTWGYDPLSPEVSSLIFVTNRFWQKRNFQLRQFGKSLRDWVQRQEK